MGFCGQTEQSLTVFSTAANVADFSWCFQDAILSLVPDILFILIAVFRIGFWLRRDPSNVKLRWHHLLNLAVAAGVCALAVVRAIRSYSVGGAANAGIAQSVMHAIALALALLALRVERSRSFRPATFLLVYWPVAAIADAVRLRSSIEQPAFSDLSQNACLALELAGLALQFALECLTCAVGDEGGNSAPCPTGGNVNVFSRITFFYMQPVMTKGKRSALTMDDLWKPTLKQTSCVLLNRFDRAWMSVDSDNSKLLRAFFKAFHPLWLIAGAEKFVAILCSYLQPILFIHLLDAVSSNEVPTWIGCVLAILLTMSSLASSLLSAQAWTNCFFTGYQLRAAVNSAIYRKSFRLSAASRQITNGGQISNHMSMDTGRIMNFMQTSHVWWTTPMSVLIGFLLLWQQLGIASLAGLAVIVAIIPLQANMGKIYERLFATKMKVADARISLIDEMLNSIRALKFYSWVSIFSNRVLMARKKELSALRSLAFYNSAEIVLTVVAPMLVTLASFATYVAIHPDTPVDPSRVFVSISLFNLIAEPIGDTSTLFTSGMAAWTSLKRLQKFLLLEELDPLAVTRYAAQDSSNRVIILNDASFTWEEAADSEPLLAHINLAIPRGSITAICGPLGSGKSSLLSALLGEMRRVSGECTIAEGATIAYLSQAAWIENATLKENVLFGRKFDEQRYNVTLQACALVHDIEAFEAGDETEIGEKGINLSGGQKQRVALARAVYADADIYLLDSPLSACDSHVGNHIWNQVIAPGGLLTGKTRVLVTPNVRKLVQTDRIVVIEGGSITEQGSFDSLLAHARTFKRMYDAADESESIAIDNADNLEYVEKTTAAVKNVQVASTVAIKAEDAVAKPTEVKAGKLMTKETSAQGAVKYAHYIAYLKASGVVWSIAAIFVACLSQAALIGTNVVLSVWSTNMTETHPTHSSGFYLGIYASIVAAAALLAGASYSLLYARQGIAGGRVLHANMLKSVLAAPTKWFDETPIGRINNRFSGDIGNIDESLVSTYVKLIDALLSSLSILVIICLFNPIFICLLVPLAIAYYLLQSFYLQSSRELKRLTMTSSSPIYSAASGSLSSSPTVRAYGRQGAFVSRFQGHLDTNQSAFLTMLCANKWMQVRSEALGSFVVLGASMLAVVRREHISAGNAGLTVSYAMQITTSLMSLLRLYGDLQNQSVAIERVVEYTTLTPEEDVKTAPSILSLPHNWPTTGAITFEAVTMRYRPSTPLVLKGLSFQIRAGERIGIVGRTGAGKSSIAIALFRMGELTGGRIMIDNVDLASVPLDKLRSSLTLIPQDPVLFTGPLRLNLDPAGTHCDKGLWSALEAVYMKDKFAPLPSGLDHYIESGGANLSVGERQMVCLARALLRGTKIVIFDEATAGMTHESNLLIQRSLRENFNSCTILYITHRMSDSFDRVMVVDDGKVTEFDHSTVLLADPTSMFTAMKQASDADARDRASPISQQH